MSVGIDWGRFPMANGRLPNQDEATGIRYGVIPSGAVDWWNDNAEAYYPDPQCPDCNGEVTTDIPDDAPKLNYRVDYWCASCEHAWSTDDCEAESPTSYYVKDGKEGLEAEASEEGDIFVSKSPYFTYAAFCSPCAPGACYLLSPHGDGEKAYCFGHDWFEGAAPYPVFSVATGELVPEPT